MPAIHNENQEKDLFIPNLLIPKIVSKSQHFKSDKHIHDSHGEEKGTGKKKIYYVNLRNSYSTESRKNCKKLDRREQILGLDLEP